MSIHTYYIDVYSQTTEWSTFLFRFFLITFSVYDISEVPRQLLSLAPLLVESAHIENAPFKAYVFAIPFFFTFYAYQLAQIRGARKHRS